MMSTQNLSIPTTGTVPMSSPNALKAQHGHPMMTTQHQQQQAQQGHQPPSANNAAPYLKDFNLVAEAAKRAQMAVLMRDIDEITLS